MPQVEVSGDVRRHKDEHNNRMNQATDKIYEETVRINSLNDPDKLDAAWEATKHYTRELARIK